METKTFINKVKVNDKEFEILIPFEKIIEAIDKMAEQMNIDFMDKNPFFISVLNGSFMFAADLLKKINIDCRISFIKLASYQGTSSIGEVKTLVGLNEDLKDKVVVILEDIVDSGNTIENLMEQLQAYNPSDIYVATLLFKPDAYAKNIKIDYVGLEVPNDFLIGFGLDYDGLGRNLTSIYKIIDN